MKLTEQWINEITDQVANEFPSFGGGKASAYNPLSVMLADAEPQFALGVPIKHVVLRVTEMFLERLIPELQRVQEENND